MKKTYIIGDIHGCVHTLSDAWEKILKTFNKEEDIVVFLGDYFDRGKYSPNVYLFIRNLQEEFGKNIVCLKGNHEEMMYESLALNDHYFWFINGGMKTEQQFNIDFDSEIIAKSELIKWLAQLPSYYYDATEKFWCVHARIPHEYTVDYDEEDLDECLWGRSTSGVGDIVFHGHTPHKGTVVRKGNDINIDTGCVFNGGLTFAIKNGKIITTTTVPTNEMDRIE